MELQTKARIIFGKKTEKLRKAGIIPAEVFGRGIKNEHVSVSAKEFSKIFKEAGENTVINLVDEKGAKTPAIISDVSFDHLKNEMLSVDFHHIRLDEKIQAKVPIEFTGEAPAVKKGLVIIKVMNEIEVEALPNEIPHRFEVDISALENPGQDISVKDLKPAAGVKILASSDATIITVAESRKEEVVTPPPAPAAEAAPAEAPEKSEENKKK
ncbi:MAG: 50S ribosomal protein L25 [Patescibacteria group bacterium]